MQKEKTQNLRYQFLTLNIKLKDKEKENIGKDVENNEYKASISYTGYKASILRKCFFNK